MARDKNGHGSDVVLLTPEVTERICSAIRSGASLDASASFGGVGRQTFYDWCRKGRGEDPERVYAEFVRAVDDALAAFEVNAIRRIEAAGAAGTWVADAWRLERRFPEKYGQRARIDGRVQVEQVEVKLAFDLEGTVTDAIVGGVAGELTAGAEDGEWTPKT